MRIYISYEIFVFFNRQMIYLRLCSSSNLILDKSEAPACNKAYYLVRANLLIAMITSHQTKTI